MNGVLWIVQIVLALNYALISGMMLTTPKALIDARVAWANAFSPLATRLIGTAELLGALGLILPMVTRILSWLTPLAARGLVGLMLDAPGHSPPAARVPNYDSAFRSTAARQPGGLWSPGFAAP